jgi:hypothetical protein
MRLSYRLTGRTSGSNLTAHCLDCNKSSSDEPEFDGTPYEWADKHLAEEHK